MNYPEIEGKLGYVFKDKSLLRRALTLPSADRDFNNQTLEFFGDAILEFLVSERIYDEDKSEGELTERRKLFVSDSALTPVSEKLGLADYFIKSKGDNILKKSKPSAYEAVLAAIYLDGGIEAARAFVNRTLSFKSVQRQNNYKGELQEFLQGEGQPLPEYRRTDMGTPQKPLFRSQIVISGVVYSGEAENIKLADQLAAKAALKRLKLR